MGNNGDGKFSTGFILGLIVGAAVVFLFGTKKGKKLLKTITEEGVGSFSDLIEEVEEGEYNDPNIDREEKVVETPEPKLSEKEEIVRKPLAHRFFRGTPKKNS